MKCFKIILSLWFGSFLGLGLYANDVDAGAKSATYGVWSPEGFDTVVLTEVNTFVAKYSRLEPIVRGAYRSEGVTLTEVLKSDFPNFDNAFANVFLVKTPNDNAVSLVERERSIILVNISALSSGGETTLRPRIERIVLREIAGLAGIEKCPNGMCCLYNYTHIQQIDRMGRNYCPPCDLNYSEKMKDLNVPIPDYKALLMQKIKELQDAKNQK